MMAIAGSKARVFTLMSLASPSDWLTGVRAVKTARYLQTLDFLPLRFSYLCSNAPSKLRALNLRCIVLCVFEDRYC